MERSPEVRTYVRQDSIVFRKTTEAFGGLSNMANGFPVRVNGVRILTLEALYQACRFPHLPEVQRLIIGQVSPMTAKMKSKPHREDSRPDWDRVRVKIMRWCLRVKLAQNWSEFSRLLLLTGDRAIVEESRNDDFWGAKVVDNDSLVGMNVLGRLLMELREEIKHGDSGQFRQVPPLSIPNFLLFGEPVSVIEARSTRTAPAPHSSVIGEHEVNAVHRQPDFSPVTPRVEQPSLFDDLTTASAGSARGRAWIDALKPYPEYMDSGQAWLGRMPKHWDVLPNRALFLEVKDRDHPDEEMLSVTITKGIIRQNALLADSSKKDSSNLDKSAYKLVLPGEIAYNKMRAWQGAIGVSDSRGIISPAYVVMRPRENHNPRYFHHLFRTPHFAKEAERWSYGITSDMWSLRPEHFRMIYTPLPSPDEQAAIMRFLDHIYVRLDKAIRAKRNVIALLNEQKQSIIHRAATRGLDTNIRLKPSGVPWLGDIPENWTLKRFKFLAVIKSGQVDPRRLQYRDLVLIAPNHIQSGTGRLLKEETAVAQGADSGKYLVNKGQIIYSKIRPNLRKATIAPRDCLCSADMYPITPKSDEVSTSYFLLLLLSLPFTKYVLDCSMRVAMPKVNREALADSWLWFPSLAEQARILEFVSRESMPFNTAIAQAEREIDLLREFRTRLIADVVTGKLDVREAARHLPSEIDEVEPRMEFEGSGDDDSEDVANIENAHA